MKSHYILNIIKQVAESDKINSVTCHWTCKQGKIFLMYNDHIALSLNDL